MRAQTKIFDVIADGNPYSIKATPYTWNESIRYRLSVNDSPVYIFAWDEDLGRLAAMEGPKGSVVLPEIVEEAIANELTTARRRQIA
jgi:hypothetical protein